LRHPDHYIRFHNVKAARLLALRDQWRQVDQALTVANSAPEARLWLVENVSGLGMKEASHFLRNVGHRGLAILDRHILRCLVGEGALAEVPEVGGKRKYLEVEQTFKAFADYVGIDSDELDLLFWSKFTGRVFK
jgi:N-glycosylase/DNA lyase